MNRVIILCVTLTMLSISSTAQSAKTSKVQKASNPRVVIDLNNTLRTDFDVASMLGINLNYLAFQRQLWAGRQVKPGVVESLGQHLPGIRYRYPGGMASNGFHWRGSLGAVAKRLDHKDVYGKKLQKPLFGVDEYLQFVERVNGAHWYVLNLVGLNPADPSAESDFQSVAQHNAGLAQTLGGNQRYSRTSTFSAHARASMQSAKLIPTQNLWHFCGRSNIATAKTNPEVKVCRRNIFPRYSRACPRFVTTL